MPRRSRFASLGSAGYLLAALLFALPGCFTIGVWTDGGLFRDPHQRTDSARLVADGVSLWLQASALPAEFANAWGGKRRGEWLALVPEEGRARAVAQMLELEARGGLDGLRCEVRLNHGRWAAVELWASLRPEVPSDFAPNVHLEIDPVGVGVRVRATATVRRSVDGPPADGARIDGVAVTERADTPIGYTAARIVLTPVSVAVDAVTLPFQVLLWAIMPM